MVPCVVVKVGHSWRVVTRAASPPAYQLDVQIRVLPAHLLPGIGIGDH
jgi:hypothetical protein